MLTHFILLPGLYLVFVEVDRLRISAEPAVAVAADDRRVAPVGSHLFAT